MKNQKSEIFSRNMASEIEILGKSDYPDSKILLTITDTSGEKTVLITPNDIQLSKASLFVEAPAERIAAKGKGAVTLIYEISKIVGYSLMAVVICFSIFSYSGAVKARIVLSGSMEPAISPGDIIITTPPENKTPQIGDIVAYTARRFNGGEVGVFSHRVIGGDANTGYIVKGDSNKAPDVQKPKLNDIDGVVIAILPFIGHFLTRQALFFIVPTIIGLWLVLDAMKNAE